MGHTRPFFLFENIRIFSRTSVDLSDDTAYISSLFILLHLCRVTRLLCMHCPSVRTGGNIDVISVHVSHNAADIADIKFLIAASCRAHNLRSKYPVIACQPAA